MIKPVALSVAALAAMLPMAAVARDNLGVFESWGAFRDPGVPRCYAIAEPDDAAKNPEYAPFASIGYWPRRNIRGQLHIRLSRNIRKGSTITLTLLGRRYTLTGGGADAWAENQRIDAAIVAALRSAPEMTVTATDRKGRGFADSYVLRGAATAMDAAALGCAKLR